MQRWQRSADSFSIGREPSVDHRDRLVDNGIVHAVLRRDRLHKAIGPLDVGGTVKQRPRRRGRAHQVVCRGSVFVERHQIVGRRPELLAHANDPIVDRARGGEVAVDGILDVDVAICARRKEPLEAAESQIARETNRKIVAIPADLTKPADAEALVKDALTALGLIDILVNNAGSAPGGVLDFLTEEHWAQSLQLKFMGYVRCLKHVLPIMQKQGRGRIVNLIGNDGVKPSYWEIAPGAANAAGQNLTLALAAQYGREDISFVAVNPGPVRTERWTGLVDAMARDMKIAREEADMLAPRSIPLGRIAECEEVASLVAYLASDLAHFINGTMIEIDGGQQKPLMDRFRDR